MPNQPKTPITGFRLSESTRDNIRELAAAWDTNMTGAVVQATEAMAALGRALDDGPVPQAALEAADEASWFNVHMPSGEAERRLAAALEAAAPFIADRERRGVLEEVAVRLEGFGVDGAVVQHFRDLARGRIEADYRSA